MIDIVFNVDKILLQLLTRYKRCSQEHFSFLLTYLLLIERNTIRVIAFERLYCSKCAHTRWRQWVSYRFAECGLCIVTAIIRRYFMEFIYVICVWLHVVVSNTYCAVFRFVLLCLVYAANFFGLSIFDCPFGIL